MSPVTREERRCRTCAHDTDECDPHHCGLDGRYWVPAAATGGEQGPSSDELEIARLRRELAEMTGCATHWCAEGGRSEREHRETLVRCRSAAQILIAEIGASGPESVEETARRAVRRIEALRHELSEASAGCRLQARTEIALRRERDEAIAKFEILDDHRRADGELIDRIGASLRNLIASVTATKTRNTIVLRDIEAARAVLGDQS